MPDRSHQQSHHHQSTAAALLDDRGYSGHLIRGANPAALVDEAVRHRVVNTYFFKEQCFALNEATLLDKATGITYIGGMYSDGQRATPFLCLVFKMLQLGVADDILLFYLREGGDEFKYLRALAAYYVRLTRDKDEDVYKLLEPYLRDYRKLRVRDASGYHLTTVDAFVDQCLTSKRLCSVNLWYLVPRENLEDEDRLDEREIPDEVQKLLDDEDEDEDNADSVERNGADANGDGDARSDSRSEGEADD